MKSASWVIREKKTKKVIMETFDKKKVHALNKQKYEAVPILAYLQEINRGLKNNPARRKTRDYREDAYNAMQKGKGLRASRLYRLAAAAYPKDQLRGELGKHDLKNLLQRAQMGLELYHHKMKENPMKKNPFKIGDYVIDTGDEMGRFGRVAFLGEYDDYVGAHRIKVDEVQKDGTTHKLWWNAKPAVKKVSKVKGLAMHKAALKKWREKNGYKENPMRKKKNQGIFFVRFSFQGRKTYLAQRKFGGGYTTKLKEAQPFHEIEAIKQASLIRGGQILRLSEADIKKYC